MTEPMRKTPGPNESTKELEEKKKEALRILLAESVRFVKTDNDINELLEQLLRAVVEHVKKDPAAALSGKGDIETLVSALKARPEAGPGGTGVSGGDIVGAFDLADLIEAIIKVLPDEKKFFMDIIRLIFCGC